MKHYTTIDIDKTDASTISSSLTDQLTADGIDFRSKMIDIATDGCSTMTYYSCNNFGPYSAEARKACRKTCGLCSSGDQIFYQVLNCIGAD